MDADTGPHAAQYVSEITSHLTEDWDPHVELFDALVSALVDISEALEELCAVVRFQNQLLAAIGSMPRWDACVRCGRDTELTHVSSFEGGMICRHCEPNQIEKWEVPPPALRALQTPMNALDEEGGTSHVSVAAYGALNYHISHLMGKAPALAAKLTP